MTTFDSEPHLRDPFDVSHRMPMLKAPFVRAPEAARTIFIVTALAACLPLLSGMFFFGWRAGLLAVVSVTSCVLIEWMYYRVTRTPALLGRSHAVLTGLLLALTLPPFARWYVPVVAAVFAVVVGKGLFGGVGHFVWQPALIGRLAVAVLFPTLIHGPSPEAHTDQWPLLAQGKALVGNVRNYAHEDDYRRWLGRKPPRGRDAFLLVRPETALAPLTRGEATYGAIVKAAPDLVDARPAALLSLPPLGEALLGAFPGGIGETSVIAVLVAGLYLIYRNFVKIALPLSVLLSAAAIVAIAPIQLMSDREISVWFPFFFEGIDVGIVYVGYHLATGGLVLAAVFLATEMTTRPVTTGGQILFGSGVGVLAMLLKLYTSLPIPAYLAVLIMNSFTQTIDRLWRPRVLGQEPWVAAVLPHHD